MNSSIFDPERHQSLYPQEWDEGVCRQQIQAIVQDTHASMIKPGEWPLHPLDAESYPDNSVKRAQYGGSAGVILGMQLLHGWGYAQEPLKWQPQVLIQSYLNQPDVSVESGLQLGLSGILISAMQSGQNTEYYQSELLRNMQNTMALPYFDITSGQTGVMHLALFLFRKSGQKVWADIFRQGVDCLLENWRYLSQHRQWLWQSQVFGMNRHYYGACHGLAGNVGIMLRGHELLTDLECEMIWSRAFTTLNRGKKSREQLCNWPISVCDDNPKMLVQWCHGVAGMVTSLADVSEILAPDLEPLILNMGELIWRAGPLKKGPGICHGTAGNGYGFLYLYRRTGDLKWLERARQFAMEGISQHQAHRNQYSQGRFSLWTGDIGLAIYLHHCIYPLSGAIPGLDLF